MIRIALDRCSPVPLNEQLASRLRDLVRKGSLGPGEKLPSARELSADAGVNRLTVEAAFARLELEGLIERRQGSGTYVLGRPALASESLRGRGAPVSAWPLWQQLLPKPLLARKALAGLPYDFSRGMGDPSLIPALAFRRALQDVVRVEGPEALGYEDPQGHPALRAAIATVLTSLGLAATAEQILITSGSQQAISLTVRALLKPGDRIVVEEACYDSALKLFQLLGLQVVPAPMDAAGLDPERLEAVLKRERPGLLYCMPNYQNPTGTVMPASRRQALVRLAAQYNMPILEDDYVGELRYDGHAEPALKTLDREGGVLYTSTFSKMLMPGLRLGFVMAEGPVLAHLTDWKRSLEIACPSLLQRALANYVSVGRYRRHVRKACGVYRERRDAMVAAVRRHFPRGTRLQAPRGGLFLWVELPEGLEASALLELATVEGVSFASGERFFVQKKGAGQSCLRLNFAACEIPVIEEGIRRMGRLAGRLRASLPKSPR